MGMWSHRFREPGDARDGEFEDELVETAGGPLHQEASVGEQVRWVFQNATADSYEQEALRLKALGDQQVWANRSQSYYAQAQINATLAAKRAIEESRDRPRDHRLGVI